MSVKKGRLQNVTRSTLAPTELYREGYSNRVLGTGSAWRVW